MMENSYILISQTINWDYVNMIFSIFWILEWRSLVFVCTVRFQTDLQLSSEWFGIISFQLVSRLIPVLSGSEIECFADSHLVSYDPRYVKADDHSITGSLRSLSKNNAGYINDDRFIKSVIVWRHVISCGSSVFRLQRWFILFGDRSLLKDFWFSLIYINFMILASFDLSQWRSCFRFSIYVNGLLMIIRLKLEALWCAFHFCNL